MENDILEGLKEVGYSDFDEITLEKAIQGGAKSVDYTKVVEWLTKELQYLLSLDEHVMATSSPDDSSAFQMELSSFLKEIGCNYPSLTTGHINDRLQTKNDKLLLLENLITELKAARMIKASKPEDDDELQVKLNESSTANELKNLLMILKFPKPPANIPISVLFTKVENKVKELVNKAPPELIGRPMFKGKLTDKQWNQLGDIQKELHEEYKIRRKMLLTRLDVTLQSFEWSDRLKAKVGDIEESYNVVRKRLSIEPNVRLSDILVAREDLAITEKTSSASVRRKTKSDINYVVIGMVPDRGGRPHEQEPPPPEMPSWQQRPGGGGRGGGGGQRGGRGGGGDQRGGRGGGGDQRGGRGGGQFGRGGGGNQFGGGGGSGNFSNYSSNQQPTTSRVQAGWNQDHSSAGYQDRSNNSNYQNHGGGYGRQQSAGYQGSGNVGAYPPSNTGYQSNSPGYNTSSAPGNYYNTGSGLSSQQYPSRFQNAPASGGGSLNSYCPDRRDSYSNSGGHHAGTRPNYSSGGYYQDKGRR